MTDAEQPPDDQRLEDPPPSAVDGARQRGRSPARLELRSRFYYGELPEIDITWEGCSPSIENFIRLLRVLATYPDRTPRPGPEAHQR
jgi:hypothetical protein